MPKQELVCLMYVVLIGVLNAEAFVRAARSYVDRHAPLGAMLMDIPRIWHDGLLGPSTIPVAVASRRSARQ